MFSLSRIAATMRVLAAAIAIAICLIPASLEGQNLPGQHREPGKTKFDKNKRPGPDGREPMITLRVSPAVATRGEQIQLSWEVRDARPGIAWDAPVSLRSNIDIRPPLPRRPGLTGQHTFSAGPSGGTITLETAGRTKIVSFSVNPPPQLTSISPERIRAGERLTLRGHNFGRVQGDSRVEQVGGQQNVRLTVDSWSDERIVVGVPASAPAGALQLRVSVGHAHVNSNTQTVHVIRSITVTDAQLRAMSSAVGLDQTRIHLHHGRNASTVGFSQALRQAGVDNIAFTIPDVDVTVRGRGILDVVSATATYRINNVDSESVTVGISEGRLELRVAFGSGGTELLGSGVAPNVQMNHARLTVKLTPGMANNRLALTGAAARFSADIHVDADWLDALVNAIRSPDGRIRSAVERQAQNAFNRETFRNALATALSNALGDLQINRLIRVSGAGNSITIEYE